MKYQQKSMTRIEYEDFLKVCAGDKNADIVLKNATYLDVFTNRFKTGDIAIAYGTIAGIGDYSGGKEIDMLGKTIVPGFIDGHIHIESTTVVPETFAKEALKHGTTAILTDPHEIANVLGVDGIQYMLEATEGLPMDIYFMIPSCVPSCEYDESGTTILANDIEPFYSHKRVLGLAELMDVKGVVSLDPKVLDKTFLTIENDKLIDGHAPLFSGRQLMNYVASGVLSDHECSNMEEAIEKMGLGVWIMIREGTAAQNLEGLVGLCREPYASRCMFCTDDRHINDVMESGHIDYIIRKAISLGVEPAIAYKMASYTTGNYMGLRDRGAISPGFLADFVVLNDVEKVDIHSVFKAGIQITDEYLEEKCKSHVSEDLIYKSHHTFNMPTITVDMIKSDKDIPILGVVEGQLYTTREGFSNSINTKEDILKAVVVERHNNTGHIGIGYVKGYGLKKGAIATSVAHDAHNIIAIGVNDEDIVAAVNEIRNINGGMLVYNDGKVKAAYALPVAGIMSEASAEDAKEKLDKIHNEAYSAGVKSGIDPFMTLGFTALPVIPELRITTMGVLDVVNGELYGK